MEDIVPELLNKILEDFRKSKASNSKLHNLQKKIDAGTATYTEANEYATIISSSMKTSFAKYMKSDNLPDGRCYYNIAERIISASEHEQYELIADFTESVQAVLNKRAQIGLKAQRVTEDMDAVKSLLNIAANVEQYDGVAKSVAQSVERMGLNVVDRSVKENAEFQTKAGLNPQIIRKTDGKCCEWCSKMAGIYNYPDNVPGDVYKRHNNCSCTVEYDPGSGRRQNVWNKQWRDEAESDRIEERKKYINYNKSKLPDSYRLPDEYIHKSVGAKTKNYDVMDLDTGEMYHLVEGTYLRNKKVFAGKGSKNVYRKAFDYSQKYGGKADDWKHVKGIGVLETEDGDREAEIHWSECDEVGKVELFVKRWLDEG